MSDFFGKLKSGAEKVAFEAEKMTRLNRARGELEKITGQIQAQFVKLGELYFSQWATTGVSGPAFDEICTAIEELEGQARLKSEEVQRIDGESYGQYEVEAAAPQAQTTIPPAPAEATPTPVATPAPAATKFCPNCGKKNQAAAKFCTDCGTSL